MTGEQIPIKIAVCLYGQFRTGVYCMPWIYKQFEWADTRYYVHTKANSKYTNTHSEEYHEPHVDDIAIRVQAALSPKVLRVISKEQDAFAQPGYWHYAPMFSSMQASVYSALNYFTTENWYPDLMVVQRFDMLVGPETRSLCRFVTNLNALNPHTIYTLDRNMRFKNEANQSGIHDVFLLGSMEAINRLVAETLGATQMATATDWKKFYFEGPNVFLRKCAERSGLHVEQAGLAFALVRPEADRTGDVLTSFDYHNRFWAENHKGIARHLEPRR